MKNCAEELVYAQTEDGLLLEGAVIRPVDVAARPLGIVMIHGLTGRFYGPMIVRLGRLLAAGGYTFVTGNNRGHDFGTTIWTLGNKMRFAGGAWERFEESPRDVGAWVDFAAGLGLAGVVLIGHSLGSLKAVYYQAQRQDPRVRGLVLASPPVRAGRAKPDLLALAEQMVAEGRGRDLLPWGIVPVGGGTLSALTYLNRARGDMDLFGAECPNPAVAQVRCPMFAFYGTDERWVGSGADLELIRRNATGSPRVDTRLFAGANHRYTDHEPEVAAAILAWLDGLAE